MGIIEGDTGGLQVLTSRTGGFPMIRVKMTSQGPQLEDGQDKPGEVKMAPGGTQVQKLPSVQEVSPQIQGTQHAVGVPRQANQDILPMSTGVPILPTQSAQITGRVQTLVFKIWRFVISNAGTAWGAADWIVNDIKIDDVSQFGQSGDLPGEMFTHASNAPNAIDTFVRFAPVLTAMNVVVVVTYIGFNESGCPFFSALIGTGRVGWAG